MLWSPNEVIPYLKEDLQNNATDRRENIPTPRSAFGGFSAWNSVNQDFVFIAENSEIYGPNPLFTIPSQSKEIDLNMLSTRILSADYQGLSSKKKASLNHVQLLMPDVSTNIHIAVNYFLLFDTGARGFIRPTCIAYVTSDKYKLICCAECILKVLSEASTILQHCNMSNTVDSLKTMLQETASQSNNGNSNKKIIQNKIAESVTKDIQDIIDVIETYEGNDVIDKQLFAILENFKVPGIFSEVNKLFNMSNVQLSSKWKSKNHSSMSKDMKSLYSVCGSGLILGLYHLYIMHKHFRRKYENIYLEKHFGHQERNDVKLHFGACVKASNMEDNPSFIVKDCILGTKRISKVPSMDSEQYFSSLDTKFVEVLLDFLNWEKNFFHDSEENNSFYQSSNFSDISTEHESSCSFSSGYLSCGNEDSSCLNTHQCGHVVPLENIWDILEDLQRENSGFESAFLEILKLFDDTKRILFSVFTRTPVVIISTPEESETAQNFIKALSVFIPRKKDEVLLVEINREEPLEAEHFKYIVGINVCIHNKIAEEIVPPHLWDTLCILNLKDCTLTAPVYTGVLLSNIDERFRMLPLDGPAFPIIVGILCEIQSAVEWWLMVTLPSVEASAASASILSKGFSRFDVQILLTLSKLCRS